MTRTDFISSDILPGQLNRLLNDPVMVQALEIVRNEGVPPMPFATLGDLMQQAALTGARANGWQTSLKALQTLTIPKTAKTDKLAGTEFDHDAIERMIASGYTEDQAKAFQVQYHQQQSNQPTQ